MNLKLSLIICAFAILGVVLGTIYPIDLDKLRILGVNNARQSDKVLNARFYSAKDFQEGIVKAQKVKSSYSGNKIYGGIIPHHLLPGYILSDFFEKLSAQNPKKIILVGPNHHERGGIRPITSKANWKTEHGILASDYADISMLVESNTLIENDDVVIGEHSIGGILHYIKYYLPEAQVIPVVLSGFTSQEDISNLTVELQKYIDEDTVVIAAVDFSHYLNADQAKANDVVTQKIMSSYDYYSLSNLNNDYVDSPDSIGLLLHLMESINAKKQELLFNTNSGEILENNTIQTTSYFSILFTK